MGCVASDRIGSTVGIGVFAKAPIPGQTKTRLAASVGDVLAAELHVAFLSDTLKTATAFAPTVLFTSGDHEHPTLVRLARVYGATSEPQRGADLGERMANAIEDLLTRFDRAIILGSDSPSMPSRILSRAASAPGIAFGPSRDGGFYLVASNNRPCFSDIEWSAPTTLKQTMQRNPGAGLLEPWFDVDHVEDLNLLATMLELSPHSAPHTHETLVSRGLAGFAQVYGSVLERAAEQHTAMGTRYQDTQRKTVRLRRRSVAS